MPKPFLQQRNPGDGIERSGGRHKSAMLLWRLDEKGSRHGGLPLTGRSMRRGD
jgi:hypothetical protein